MPERKRKIILWSIVIIIGLSLGTWWIKNFQKRLESFEKEKFIEEFGLSKFKEELEGVPKIEIPKIEIPKIENHEK